MKKHFTIENLVYAALISLICLGINWRDKRTATVNYNNGFKAGAEYVIDTLNKIADELETKNLCDDNN